MRLFLYWLVQCTWGIIQNLIGAVVFLFSVCFLKPKKIKLYKQCVSLEYSWGPKVGGWGFSIGGFTFMSDDAISVQPHEYGHTVQSLILGPLCLFVILIPSLIWFWCFDEWRTKKGIPYSWFYPEKWADYLGAKYPETE